MKSKHSSCIITYHCLTEKTEKRFLVEYSVVKSNSAQLRSTPLQSFILCKEEKLAIHLDNHFSNLPVCLSGRLYQTEETCHCQITGGLVLIRNDDAVYKKYSEGKEIEEINKLGN